MSPARVRSRLFSAACLVLVVLAWVYLAPTQIGGSASYVVTGGVSMQPRFHAGDLALVRPAAEYRVGDIVAYHSTLLHVVVLHRIIARSGNHYTFKGDNNNFVDPAKPVRSQLVGKLWLHIPRGGVVLHWLHTPITAALLIVALGLFSLLGAGETRRPRRRRRPASGSVSHSPPPMKTTENPIRSAFDPTAVLMACAVAAVLFLGLGVFALSRPSIKSSRAQTPYTQQIRFGYSARAQAGDVYPTGNVSTGNPIFLALVHRVRFRIDYHLATRAPHDLAGTEQVFLRLTGPTGWSRSLPLGPLRRFRGVGVRTQVTVDLPSVQSLIARVEQLTGAPAAAGYTVAVAPQVHIRGGLAGHAIDTAYTPALNFQLTSSQLQPGGASTSSGFTRSQAGTVSTAASSPNSVVVLKHTLSVAALRWVALLGLLVSAALAVIAVVVKRLAPSDEAARIQAEYGHLIIPVVLGPDGLGGPPVDVPTIAALARLAECGQRLILHSRDERRDTYLLNDEGTVYRYRADPGNVVWGEWSATTPRPLSHVAAPARRPAVRPRPATATPMSTAPVGAAAGSEPLPAGANCAGTTLKVFPPPPFLPDPAAEPATQVLAAEPVLTTPAPAAVRPTPPAPGPMPSPTRATRPRLRRWAQAQAERVRLVRELGSAFLGTSERQL